MDRGARQAIVHEVAELDMTEQVSMHRYHCWVETAMVHAYLLVLASVTGFLIILFFEELSVLVFWCFLVYFLLFFIFVIVLGS